MARPFARLTGLDWQRIRCRILLRDDFTCQYSVGEGICGFQPEDGDLSKLHVHHKTPVEKGGPDEDWNLITICEEHHRAIHPFMKHVL